jgi:hypothetical protein
MNTPELLLVAGGVAAAGLVVLLVRGLLSPRQFALAVGGLACGAVIGVAWAGGGHG